MSGRDVAIVQEIDAKFGTRKLEAIAEGEWIAFVDDRNAGNSPATTERYKNGVMSFLNWCHKKPRRWVTELPAFERDQETRKPKHRRARRVAELTPTLVMLMIENASAHYAAQLATLWSTGCRVSSVLFGCRVCDVILADGRSQITFHDTKSGEPVVAALHPWAAARLEAYLKWRGNLHEREAPLFLTHRRKPYSLKGRHDWGNHNRSAFAAMKDRTIADLRRRAAAEAWDLRRAGMRRRALELVAAVKAEIDLVRQVTQHWFRHLLVTTIMAKTGNLRAAMEQQGWSTAESVTAYMHDVAAERRAVIDALPIGRAGAAPAAQLSLAFKGNRP